MSDVRKVTEREVQAALMTYAMDEKSHAFAIPNSNSIFRWETDLLSATKAGLFHEWEIKLSLADYRRDFNDKKYKHSILKKCGAAGRWIPCYFWFVTCGFEPDEIPDYAGWMRYDRSISSTWYRRIVIEKPAPRLDGRRLEANDFETAARLLSYRLKNIFMSKRYG